MQTAPTTCSAVSCVLRKPSQRKLRVASATAAELSDKAGELQALLQRTVRAGGEGLMLHKGSSLYRSGRSDDLIKLKTHEDTEALVVGHLPGKGKHAGRLGALLVEMPSGQRFRLGAGLTDADRADPPPIGSWVTYRFRGTHDGGLPRFASFVRVRLDRPVATIPTTATR